jgi:glucose-1-phosphatase
MKQSFFDLLLFDLGGVLVKNRGIDSLSAWLPNPPPPATIMDRWLMSPTVRDLENGQISPEEFALKIVSEWKLPVSPIVFLDDFSLWASKFYPGAADLLHRLGSEYNLACLSNTNVLHWQRGRTVMKIDRFFDYTFVSCETGLLKPDEEAFLYVSRQTGFPLDRILLLDDSQRNVDSAASLGMVARRALGIQGIRSILREFSILE